MNMVIIYHHTECLLHKSAEFHVERPERTERICDVLMQNKMENWLFKEAPLAAENQVKLVHTRRHWDYVNYSIAEKATMLDGGDTYACGGSLKSALRAAGSVVAAVDDASAMVSKRFFCCIRPPGHHAESDRVMGFCIFNNVAIGAAYATRVKGYNRVAIIDWDVHHGNGTQEIFYSDPNVLFISIHQHPLYPGTGMRYETGNGVGKGFTYNFPVNPGTDGNVYREIFSKDITNILREYNPELVFISAGFDAHKDDPLADILLTEEDYTRLTHIISELAKEMSCPIISVLEGGYNLDALGNSVLAHVRALTDKLDS